MYQICPVFCVFFFLFHGFSGSSEVKDGNKMTIQCDPKQGTMVLWFRLKESGAIEFLASFSSKGDWKAGQDQSKFENNGKTFIVDNFDKHKDSGVYSCVSINANKLVFGEVTHLLGEPDPTTVKIPVPTTTAAKTQEIRTTKPVSCQKNSKAPKKIESSLGCELHVFVPLLAGCGLLLLLLLITILYCNRIRTRRCPHHYKRQPRSAPTGHKALPNPPGF